jgi:hypothetical protein
MVTISVVNPVESVSPGYCRPRRLAQWLCSLALALALGLLLYPEETALFGRPAG